VIPRRTPCVVPDKGDPLPASPALFWWCGGILPASALTWVLYRFNPSQYGFYPRCVFNLVTGLLCPGCGAQRALHQLVHGHILIACRCNLLLMLALPWLAFMGVRHARATLRGTRPPGWLPNPRWAGLMVAVLLGFTLLRNLPGAPFCYLAPP
jgi:hypothetical protein